MTSGDDKNDKKVATLKRNLSLADLVSAHHSPLPPLQELRDSLSIPEITLAKLASQDFGIASGIEAYLGRDALQKEISELREQFKEKAQALRAAEASTAKRDKEIEGLRQINEQLKTKEDLRHLLDRVHGNAQKKLIEDEEFRAQLAAGEECDAFVMSVDIRRSTELMLKAREPARFAEFITALSEELFSCVIRNNGVFDKFTGDGILAFFPANFSGPDAAYFAIKAASECHKVFERIYKTSRRSFSSILKGVGLGIGIDYGRVRLLKVAEGLTVVGAPVVYACRLSGAPAGRTYLNQPAVDHIEDGYRRYCTIEERSVDIKHEGEIVAYDVSLSHVAFDPQRPDWQLG